MTDARMTHPEAVILCRFAKACCPQQAFDEYTPDAWFELLKDLRFEDCKEAVVKVVRDQPFVSPSEIRKAIKRVRIDRLEKFGAITPPHELADDPGAEVRWQNAVMRRVADGELTREQWDREQPGLKARDVRAAIAGSFRRVDDEPEPGDPGPCTVAGCDDPWCDHEEKSA